MKIHLDTETKTIYVYEAKLVELLDLIHSIDSEHREEWVVKDSVLTVTVPYTYRDEYSPPYKVTCTTTENTNESGIYNAKTSAGVSQDHPLASGSYTFTRYPNGTASYTGVNPAVGNS